MHSCSCYHRGRIESVENLRQVTKHLALYQSNVLESSNLKSTTNEKREKKKRYKYSVCEKVKYLFLRYLRYQQMVYASGALILCHSVFHTLITNTYTYTTYCH